MGIKRRRGGGGGGVYWGREGEDVGECWVLQLGQGFRPSWAPRAMFQSGECTFAIEASWKMWCRVPYSCLLGDLCFLLKPAPARARLKKLQGCRRGWSSVSACGGNPPVCTACGKYHGSREFQWRTLQWASRSSPGQTHTERVN